MWTDQPSVASAGKGLVSAGGVGGGLGAGGGSVVANAVDPVALLPNSRCRPNAGCRSGNVGNGRASQFQTQQNAQLIIGTPPTVALLPSTFQYS